jgi:hypothetical protein
MTKNNVLAIVILAFSLPGCERIELDKSFYSKVGDKFKVDYNLSFSIDSIDDYRCPLLFECIWSGDVRIHCTFYEPGHRTDTAVYLINTHNLISIGGYNFKLLSVNPQSQQGELIPQDEYKMEIIVQRN